MSKNNEGASDKLAPFWKDKIAVARNAKDIKIAKPVSYTHLTLPTKA